MASHRKEPSVRAKAEELLKYDLINYDYYHGYISLEESKLILKNVGNFIVTDDKFGGFMFVVKEADQTIALLDLKPGENIGLKVNKDLAVMQVVKTGPSDGKFAVGDVITHINGKPVTAFEQWEEAVAKGGNLDIYLQTGTSIKTYPIKVEINGSISIFGYNFESFFQFMYYIKIKKLVRLEDKSEFLIEGIKPSSTTNSEKVQKELPPEREKLVTRREGFLYNLVTIEHQKGCKFGLGIKHYQNKVIVSRVDDGSLSAKSLIAGDRIIDINGVPVSDKDVARDLLLKSLQKTRKVSLVVERACSDEAIALANAALLASEQQPPSVARASDVRDIIARQKEMMSKPGAGTAKKDGIMRKPGANNGNLKVQVLEEKKEHIIASDNEGKTLKKVAK